MEDLDHLTELEEQSELAESAEIQEIKQEIKIKPQEEARTETKGEKTSRQRVAFWGEDVPGKPHYIPEQTAEAIAMREVLEKYADTKAETVNLIDAIGETGKVDKAKGEAVASDIQSQVNDFDASQIIQAINRIRAEDEYLHTHSLNVAFLNGLMGKWMNFDPDRQGEVVKTGLFHDIGKLRIDQDILNKPARLTPEEFDEIKKHPGLSLETLVKSGIKSKAVLEGVMQHHEKVNGTGYPQGLDSNEISEFARITAISDIYDAMVASRVYKKAHSPFEILNNFAKEGYSELDIFYVNVFVDCMVEELKGKKVVMSDGSTAVIRLVHPRDLLHPVVEINGKIVKTDDELYCVRLKED